MRLMRSKAAWSVTAPDYGRQFTVGELVDLDARLPAGGTLADAVGKRLGDLLEPAPKAPTAKRATRTEPVMTEPGDPAKETIDG